MKSDLKPSPGGYINGIKVIGTKWVYKVKTTVEGAFERFKARLVCQGFNCPKDPYWSDTNFSPTPKMTTLKVLLSYLANVPDPSKWHAVTSDIRTAFLYADVQDEVYIKQPKGFEIKGNEKAVFRLKKSLYGLRSAPKAWFYDEIAPALTKQGFVASKNDTCLFIKREKSMVTFALVYVDDICFITSNRMMLKNVLDSLKKRYTFSSVSDLTGFLGLKISKTSDGSWSMSSEAYIESLIEEYELQDEAYKGIDTPWLVGPNGKLTKAMCPTTNEEILAAKKLPYCSVVGSLQYLVSTSRPDIAYAVSAASRYMTNYGPAHYKAVVRILLYLRNTKHRALIFRRNPSQKGGLILEVFCDSDWGGEVDTRRSQGGYICRMNGSTVECRSMLQKTVALSSTEAEFIIAAEAAKAVVWLRRLLGDLGCTQNHPTVIWEDNRAAICISNNPTSHHRTKHIQIRHFWLRELVSSKEVVLLPISTEDQLADILTKNVGTRLYVKLRDSIMDATTLTRSK